MTTAVIISSPKPNHQRVRARSYYRKPDGTLDGPYSEVILGEGENTLMYVYGAQGEGNQLVEIDEVPIPAAATAERRA